MTRIDDCPCHEIGKDGTTTHSEPSKTVLSLGRYPVGSNPFNPCENHLDNYSDRSIWYKVEIH